MARAPKPKLPPLERLPEREREEMAVWVKSRIEEIDRKHLERIERLREGGEHPTPYHQKQVRLFSMMGVEEKHIARMLQLTHRELMTHYEEDLEIGYVEGIVTMSATLHKIGSDPYHKDAAKVALEWLSRRGGDQWKPPAQKHEVETSNKKEGRIIDSSNLSYEDRQKLREILMRNLEPGELPPPEEVEDSNDTEENDDGN